ncbi:hypothetical protein M1247_20770 [Mycobacterium sp. 21AC1]|uniref:hypothetical protein n=1 Tax=[Mycobacterium] appelbergii TaxID=2939269 RepID=UPI002938F08D|nr:hypothetical protein [Mycobacterium sp. 21AC1]MDV3127370.1 hypothetical protein [Mycobacterium sp. 21AC1]
MTLRRFAALFGAFILALMVSACADEKKADAAGSTPERTAPDPKTAVLTIEIVETMNSTLQELAGAELNQIQVSSVSISTSGNMAVDALDPAKPTEFNKYVSYWDGRTDVRPYDYGGAEKLPALQETLFPADTVPPQTLVDVWTDSFERVEGERAELNASAGPTVTRADETGPVEIYVVNGTERDRQTVYYDATGNFLRVS